jgi:hypothetical protein
MAKSAAERNKARRIRRKIEAGKATENDRIWLARYESERGAATPPRKAPPRDTPPPEVKPETHRPAPETSPPPTDAPKGFVPIVFNGGKADAEPETPDPEPETRNPGKREPRATATASATGKCSIPNCPQCSGLIGSRVCEATGKNVWPPMEETAARYYADGLLGIIRIAIKIARKDKYAPPPSDKEKADLARAVQLFQARRVNGLSAIDDIVMLVMVVATYSGRAMATKPPAKDTPVIPPVVKPAPDPDAPGPIDPNIADAVAGE